MTIEREPNLTKPKQPIYDNSDQRRRQPNFLPGNY